MSRKRIKVEAWGTYYGEWETGEYSLLSKEELESLDVRQLLDMKNFNRRAGKCPGDYMQVYVADTKIGWGYYAVYLDDLKSVLAGKPHVPNKREAKAIRQEKAKRGT